MPALNIYITDDLKRRMGKINANWSDTEVLNVEKSLIKSAIIDSVKI